MAVRKTAALCRLEAHLALAVSGFQRKATLMVHHLRVQALDLRSFDVSECVHGTLDECACLSVRPARNTKFSAPQL